MTAGGQPRAQDSNPFPYVFLGSAFQSKRWALSQGDDPESVYPAAAGTAGLEGIPGPFELVRHSGHSPHYAKTLANMAAVLEVVLEVNARHEDAATLPPRYRRR